MPGRSIRGGSVCRAVVAVSALLALAGHPRPAHALACGDVVTESVKLTDDLVCNAGDALHVGADGITIDLGGHTISGPGTGFGFTGIAVDGHDGVRIKNGTITDSFIAINETNVSGGTITGILARGDSAAINVMGTGVTVTKCTCVGNGYAVTVLGDGNTIAKNTVSSTGEQSIFVIGDANIVSKNAVTTGNAGVDATGQANLIAKNVVTGNRSDGIRVSGSAAVEGNTVVGNQRDGIRLETAPGSTIAKNTLTANQDNGVYVSVDSGGCLVAGNRASGNSLNGIDAESTGAATRIGKNVATFNRSKGILAQPGVTDLGGNQARANGDPAGCSVGVIACGR